MHVKIPPELSRTGFHTQVSLSCLGGRLWQIKEITMRYWGVDKNADSATIKKHIEN